MKYDIEQIEQYLNSELSAADVKAFELRMTEDRDFAYEVKLHQTAIEAIQYSILRERTAEIHREVIKEKGVNQSTKLLGRRVMMWGALTAVATLLLFFLVRLLIPSSEPASPTIDDSFVAVLSQIGDSDAIMDMDSPAIEDADSIYKLGITYINQTKYAEANEQFDLLTTDHKKYEVEATFYKAYAYWKMGENEEAKQQLQKIIDNKNATDNLKDKAKHIIDNLQ